MKPLLGVVAICLVLTVSAYPENIEEVKELSQSNEPVVEAEASAPQARKERCTTCGSQKLGLKSPNEVLAALQALPGAEVHTQQSFESCTSEKGCAGVKVKDGQVVERFGNSDSFKAAAAADIGNEFTFHSVLDGAIPDGGPFWWMNQNSPFKAAGGAGGNFEKFSKSSSSYSTTGNAGNNAGGFGLGAGGAGNLAANPFLNGDFSKLSAGFTGAGAEAGKPGYSSSSFESSSFSSSSKGDVDLTKNPFLNGGIKFGQGGFAAQGGFGAGGNQFGAGATGAGQSGAGAAQGQGFNSQSSFSSSGNSFGAQGAQGAQGGQGFGQGAGNAAFQGAGNAAGAGQSQFSGSAYNAASASKFGGAGYTGSSPSPFMASSGGSNVNLIQSSQKGNEFDFEQSQQSQQNIDEAFQSTGNVHAHDHSGGELQQTCAGQGYVCVHKAQCNNGVVNTNGAGVLQAKTQKQYCNTRNEICCRIEISTLSGAGGLQGSLGVGSATFQGSGSQGSGLFVSGQADQSGQSAFGQSGQSGQSAFGQSGQAGQSGQGFAGQGSSSSSFGAGQSSSSFGSGQSASGANGFGSNNNRGAFGQGTQTQTSSSFEGSSTFGSNSGTGFQGTGANSGSGFQAGAANSGSGFRATGANSGSGFQSGSSGQGFQSTGSSSGQGFQAAGSFGSNTGSANRGVAGSSTFESGSSFGTNKFGASGTFGNGFSTVAPTTNRFGAGAGGSNFNNEVYKSTSQSNFVETDSFSSGSETAGIFRPGASGSGLKPGIPYLPPVDNINQPSIISSTVLPTTFTTARPFTPRPTPPKPTYLPPVTSTSAPGYLPPEQSDSSNYKETRVPGPTYTDGGIILDENRQPNRKPNPLPNPSEFPAGCAAALKCTPVEFCTAEGVISNTTVVLTRDQEAYRVPLTDCKDLESGRIGKCCRDPLYTDPWPTNQLGKWVPGVFGGNDGKYVSDSKISGNNPRPQVTARPPVTGSVLLNNYRPKPTVPAFGPNQVTPGFPSNTVSSFTQKGQFESRGQGSFAQGGQGQFTKGGQGQFAQGGQGQFTQGGQGQFAQGGQTQLTQGSQTSFTKGGQATFAQGGQGQFAQGGQGQFAQGGQGQFAQGGQGQFAQGAQGQFGISGQGAGTQQTQGSQFSSNSQAFAAGQRGQGQSVTQGQGQFTEQGQGAFAQGGRGQAAFGGQGQLEIGGLGGQGQFTQFQSESSSSSSKFGQGGQGLIQGQGQGVNRGQGASVTLGGGSGLLTGQGSASQGGAGLSISQGGFGTGFRQGFGTGVIQGQGQGVSTGFGSGIRQGFGQAIVQGEGQTSASEQVYRVFLGQYGGNGQCGILNSQKPYGNRNDLEVDFAEIPWQAMVLLQTNKSLLCGGVITRPDVVITSANCVDGLNAKNVLIKGGEWKLGIDDEPLPFQIVQVKTILRHPFYKSGAAKYDAAILVLSENLRLAKNIFPICLPRADETLDAFYNGAGECVVTGWGKQVLQAHLEGSIMHSLNVSLINPGECQAKLSQDYPHLLEQYDQDSCACGQPLNPVNNICKVDIGSALACTTDNSHYVLRGIYSWDSGCQTGNQLAAFYKFDLEWYEWAIGLIESARFVSFSSGTKVTQGQFSGQLQSAVKGSSQYSGSSGIKGFQSSSLNGFGASGAGGGAVTSFGGASGASGAVKGSSGFGSGQFGFSQFGASSKFTEGNSASNFGAEIKGPISNSFSASYSEKKVFQSEPKIITYTTKPEIVTFTTKPEYFTYTTKPKLVTYTTKPEIITYTTKPKIVTYTTKPQIIRYETSGSGTNPQYVAPGVSFNPSFSALTGEHQHNAQCKCLDKGKK